MERGKIVFLWKIVGEGKITVKAELENALSPINAAVKSLSVFCSGKKESFEIFLTCPMKIKPRA